MKVVLAALLLFTAACGEKPSDVYPAVADTAAGEVRLTGRVVDGANLLSTEKKLALSSKLASLEAASSDQLVVVTLPTLNGAKIEDVSLGLGRKWKVGHADKDNGVLLVVAPNERQVRIEVGYGLEGLLTDDRAGTIVREMLPKFRAGDLPAGIELGVDRIQSILLSDPVRPRYLNEVRRKAAA